MTVVESYVSPSSVLMWWNSIDCEASAWLTAWRFSAEPWLFAQSGHGSAQFSVHTRASTSTHPATTQTWSRSTARFGEHESSAESSTNTDERPELVSKATVHWP